MSISMKDLPAKTQQQVAQKFFREQKTKYHNKKVSFKGMTFDSNREADRYFQLRLLERGGRISNLRRQVKFILIPAQYENGKCIERECAYFADFVYEQNGKTIVEDVKSEATRTPQYIIKRKLLLEKFGYRIKET